MPHPILNNPTPLAFESLFLTDENAQPLFVALVQGCYSIVPRQPPSLLAEQPKINIAGECWGEDPAKASLKYEPQIAFMKPATDIVLIGHAYAPRPGETEVAVGLRVGPVQKVLKVTGDRYLFRRGGLVSVTAPQPFEKIPLIYEKAFGGWDLRDPTPGVYRFEPRNPVGMGYRDITLSGDDQVPLPNLEDPQRPYRGYGDTPPPAGFGFIAPHWQPRAALAGTYDEAWSQARKPLLPTDFDRRFFNAAAPGLIAPGHLKGDEAVTVVNASPEGKESFTLPAVPPPRCKLELRGKKAEILQTRLDTVIINMDERLLFLIWRAYLPVRNGAHDIVSIEVLSEGILSPPAG